MKLFIYLHHIAKESKTKKATQLPLLELVEVENSHMSHLNPIVRSMVFCIIFLLQGHLYKMESLRGKIELCQKLQEQC